MGGFSINNNILCKAEVIVKKRNKDKHIDSIELDEQISLEMHVYKTDYVRTSRKKALGRIHTS